MCFFEGSPVILIPEVHVNIGIFGNKSGDVIEALGSSFIEGMIFHHWLIQFCTNSIIYNYRLFR